MATYAPPTPTPADASRESGPAWRACAPARRNGHSVTACTWGHWHRRGSFWKEREAVCCLRQRGIRADVLRARDEQSPPASRGEGAPQPQPEHEEPKLQDPTPLALSVRDYRAIVVRAGKEAIDDHITNLAAAIAYYSFLAIPSLLLVAVGVF